MSLESRFRHILAAFGQPVPTAGKGMIFRPCVPIDLTDALGVATARRVATERIAPLFEFGARTPPHGGAAALGMLWIGDSGGPVVGGRSRPCRARARWHPHGAFRESPCGESFAIERGLLASDDAGNKWRATVQPRIAGPVVAMAVGPGRHLAVATSTADGSRHDGAASIYPRSSRASDSRSLSSSVQLSQHGSQVIDLSLLARDDRLTQISDPCIDYRSTFTHEDCSSGTAGQKSPPDA
jgi:hypothetical protein